MQEARFRLARDGERRLCLFQAPSPHHYKNPRVNRVARKFLGDVCLEKIQQTLTDREETEGGAGKKCRANERLVSQRCERTRLKVTDFSHELIERLPFCFALLTQQAKT